MAEQSMTSYPRFAVVGHPNKGKSSVVSSLANDDSVQISDIPGTTTKSRSFPLKVDGRIVYELFDTPGFQRARRVLAWLQQYDVPAHKRIEAVEAFLREHRRDPLFRDEIALLTPIMAGAGIIYVVDGSKPYGEEYEAEMEILRWTGQPSMALINQIDPEENYTDEWRRALEQYFRIVRTYDPMQVDLDQKLVLLEAMAQLNEAWTASVKSSIGLFAEQERQKQQQSAKIISHLVQHSLSYVAQCVIRGETASEEEQSRLLHAYQDHLRTLEQQSQRDVETLWQHRHLKKTQEMLHFNNTDLFSTESASIFGLSREEILVTGVTGGAVTGAGMDLLFAGHTLLLGGAIGAVVGGVGAYFGFDRVSEATLLGQKLGKRSLVLGPMKNKNFPYILLGRALYHLSLLAKLSHARRGSIEIAMDISFKRKWLDNAMRKSLETLHKKFRSGKEVTQEEIEAYETLVWRCIKKVI